MNEDKSSRYHRLKRRASLASTVLVAAALAALALSGASAAWRDVAESFVGHLDLDETLSRLAVTTTFVVGLILFLELLMLPLSAFTGFVLERRYEMSTERLADWLKDYVKAAAVSFALGTGAALVVYEAWRAWPDTWWLMAAAAFALVTVVLALVAPVLLFPLFYRFVPIDREELRRRLTALADRAGARVVGVYEWKLGTKSRRGNAALVGFGPTRRIIVSDTVLSSYSDEEIEVILAHELAHHVHKDLWTAVAVDAVVTFAGLFAAHTAMSLSAAALGLRGPADVAGLPVLLLVAGACALLTVPFVNALSRAHERRADRFALDLTGNVPAFVSAMKRLGAQNLAEERPPKLVEVLFHSHPSISERVRLARAWQAPGDGHAF